MVAISTDSITKKYGDIAALETLSITIEEGELYGLLGPNGAGKSTTIGILTGQIVPDAGSVTVLGRDPITDPLSVRAAIGILPEKESPPSLLTPREFLRFCGKVRELPDDQVEEAVQTWADRLGYQDVLDVLSADLSRGQQQKVMITAAFFHDPQLVIIDEPLANLDPLVQERVKRLFQDHRDAGNTLILSTHNVDVAGAICSRVGILNKGSLVAEIRPGAIASDESLLDVFFTNVGTSHPMAND